MVCIASFIFLFAIFAQLEAGDISNGQAIFYGIYGLMVLYYATKKYSDNDKYQKAKRKRN